MQIFMVKNSILFWNFFQDFEAIVDVPFTLSFGWNFVIGDNSKIGRVEFREVGVAVERGRDLGHVDSVK